MIAVVGVDPGTRAGGWCVHVGARYKCGHYAGRNLAHLVRGVRESALHFKVDPEELRVYVEYTTRNPTLVIHTGEVLSVLGAIPGRYVLVPPTKWKKAVLGAGNASKEVSCAMLHHDDHNVADAIGIAKYGIMVEKNNGNQTKRK